MFFEFSVSALSVFFECSLNDLGEGGVKMLVLCSDRGGEGWKPHCEGGAPSPEGITHLQSRYKTELQEGPKLCSASLSVSGALI